MHKLWIVAKNEYRNRVLKRSFIIGTLSIPFLVVIFIAAMIFVVVRELDYRPLGYIDHSGALKDAAMPEDEDLIAEILPFADENSARSALEDGEIQGFYLLPEDYIETLYVDLYYLEKAPAKWILDDFDDYLRANILEGQPTPTQVRIVEGTTLTVRAFEDGREYQNNAAGLFVIMLPIMIAMFFLFVSMGATGYFLQVVTDEKENRTMEIMITSVSPAQLIGGKSVGLVLVGLTQITVWVLSIVIGWIIARSFFETFRLIQLPWDVLLIFSAFFFPSYAIIAGMMICIGSVVTELQKGQQISGVINMIFVFPIFFSGLVLADPDHPLLVFLSFWPTTSLMSIVMRWGFTSIPVWQVITSWLISVISTVLVVWVASRLFRLGMLRYGQQITIKAVFAAIRPTDLQQ